MHLYRCRPRFTVRRLMIAVVVVGLISAVGIEIRRYLREGEILRQRYRDRANFYELRIELVTNWTIESVRSREIRRAHCERLWKKYDFAAHHPWLPVAPDPPEPE
jgi:hypothetical protein